MKHRDNQFEECTLMELVHQLPDALHYDKYNSVINVQKKKNKITDRPIIFQDIESPYLTINGNPRITEFGVYASMYKLDMIIECRSLTMLSNQTKITLDEIENVKNLPTSLFCLVLGDQLLDPKFKRVLDDRIKEHDLKHKVWYGSIEQLGQLINRYKRCN